MGLNIVSIVEVFGPILGPIVAGIIVYLFIVKNSKSVAESNAPEASNSNLQLWMLTEIRDPLLRKMEEIGK